MATDQLLPPPPNLAEVLALHGQWLSGKTGQKAALKGMDLREANFGTADLRQVELDDSDLTNSILSQARGLSADQLRGTILTGAKLPKEIKESLKTLPGVDEASKNSRKLFATMLIAFLYCWLTIFATTDAALLLGASALALPIVQTPIPVRAFFTLAPLLLLSVYSYMQFSLQNLWESLHSLPAVFPDGRPLYEHAYPWLMSSFARIYFARLRKRTGKGLSQFQVAISCILAWWTVPLTMIGFWARFLVRRSGWTWLHVGLIALSVWCAQWFWRTASNTLRGRVTSDARLYLKIVRWKELGRINLVALTVASVTALLSIAAFDAQPITRPVLWNGVHPYERGSWRGRAAARIPVSWASLVVHELSCCSWGPFGDFGGVDLSSRSSGVDNQNRFAAKAGKLAGLNLRGINAKSVYAANADFSQSDLTFANFDSADLRGANFLNANLSNASFKNADLRQAVLIAVNVENSSFDGANFQGATIESAKIDGKYTFYGAGNLVLAHLDDDMLQFLGLPTDNNDRLRIKDLSGYNFLKLAQRSGRSLRGADLAGFNLRGAVLDAVDLDYATLSRADLRDSSFGCGLLAFGDKYCTALASANVQEADLRGVDLSHADGLTREQIQVACIDAKTKLPLYISREVSSMPTGSAANRRYSCQPKR
jgi:uncharacterized protein YjbI with pentapeptide repeats